MKQVSSGLEGVALAPALKLEAEKNMKLWLTEPAFADYVPAIEFLVAKGRFELLVDSFYRLMTFGTGGRRGPVGVGPNRINPYTVATSVQGHCQFLKARRTEGPWKVVVAWDVRAYHDQRGLYSPDVLGPLEGLTSRELAVLAAEVYCANGVQVVMEDPGSGSFLSTPELSFHIFRLSADGGLNISASHNPADDNGTKFYNGAGGQEIPPHDEELVRVASSVTTAERLVFEEALERGLVTLLTPHERRLYRDESLKLSQRPHLRAARVAFSSLHGTGRTSVAPVLQEAGFDVLILDSQWSFDGTFPTVPFGIPNPEVPYAMEAVVSLGRDEQCDIALATDPDADRLGLAIPAPDGAWLNLTGNQIGLLLADYLLERKREDGVLTPQHFVVKTEVTTAALDRLAEHFGVRSIGHLLVGFKYIGDVLDKAHRLGHWGGMDVHPEQFVVGMEESHGVLASPVIRDKDAANGALVLAEYAAWCRANGTTLYDRLMRLHRLLGYHGTGLRSIIMEGAVGLADISRVQQSLRRDPPVSIGHRKVKAMLDRLDESGVFGPVLSETDRSSRDVLVFELEGGARLILRPSGTEPKNKSYLELPSPPMGPGKPLEPVIRQTDEEIRALLDAWEVELLRRIGVDYPVWATGFSDSLSLVKKKELLRLVVPALLERCAAGQSSLEISAWLQDALSSKVPWPLVKAGFVRLGRSLENAGQAGLLLETVERMP